MTTSVQTLPSTEFYRAFAARVREQVATTIPAVDEAREHPTVDELEKPSAAVARKWTIRTINAVEVSGYLPPWAEGDPSKDGLAPDLLRVRLEDLTHGKYFDGVDVNVGVYSDSEPYRAVLPILVPQMVCSPHAADPAHRVPTVTIEVLEGIGDWIQDMTPGDVHALAGKLRAHADHLDAVADDLADARDDWAKNGGAR